VKAESHGVSTTGVGGGDHRSGGGSRQAKQSGSTTELTEEKNQQLSVSGSSLGRTES